MISLSISHKKKKKKSTDLKIIPHMQNHPTPNPTNPSSPLIANFKPRVNKSKIPQNPTKKKKKKTKERSFLCLSASMDSKLLLHLQNVIAYLLLFYSLGTFVNGGPITSCGQTPYPQVCNHYIGTNIFETSKTQEKNSFKIFRDQSIMVTLDLATKAYQLMSRMDLSSFDHKAKVAWGDCLELYEDTFEHLNRSMSSNSLVDSQTWLSAAIANQQVCQNGFLDLHLASYSNDFMLSNFTKLLSNSLAINKANIPSSSSSSSLYHFTKQRHGGRRLLSDDGFPSWVSAGDRKLLQSSGAASKADVVVAQDGSGNYKTISEAVAAANGGSKRIVIYVKKGVYKENVQIKRSMKNLMFVGDGIDATIVTSSNSAQETTTFRSATFGVSGDGFIAKDMTFENTAGPQKHQAVALRSGSDFSVFYGCSFKGYQDTLYVYAQRQFYRNCDIYGTVDFIFGDAAVVFQSCNIYLRKPMGGQWNTVTAQARTDPNENTGIIVHNSRVAGAGDLSGTKSYLGRPWKKYSRTVFMKCNIDGVIAPAGWLPWSGNFALSTLYYGEYMNVGEGASTSGRVNWPGFHVITSATEAGKFTVGNFLAGNSWIPATGVPFDAGL